jgi:ABC-type multidrug transport system permease subunit
MRRDASSWSSYKMQMLIAVMGALTGFASWGFNATYRNAVEPISLFGLPNTIQVSYLSFIVTGILVSNIVLSLVNGLTNGLRPWMLESILMTGIRPWTFVLGTVAWSYVLSALFFVPQLLIGVVFFRVDLSVNPISFVLSIFISAIMIFGISMASVGMRLVTKVTDPVNWLLGLSMSLLSGQTFPIQFLNNYFPGIIYLSMALPYTWIFNMVRLSTLANASIFVPGVAEAYLIGLAYGLVLVPVGLFAFIWGLKRAKKQGTLGWF